MSRSNGNQPTRISAQIRRQIGTAENKRFLRAMPLFKVDPELPETLDHLLDELDRAEKRKRRRS
ncbi:hypothetical protein MesoLjLc_05690 [Mesorhizobium sp. L-8-10]|uniref:hypothetical protein n=1 Tax=unclassified Mesorhizobium TaxID=325217 RepID=UPI001929188F|nr:MULTISPECIES: hypothetical protein [unclassified Mesorhizobium]BCH20811.1 hypothetical protein MesoLjLb_05960 [Mesorhizobium sp. L-8-3]BCH28639.1 hypothetical protein MesoLjLc_05690 [Mesorhizobium sp. L-8-10]